MVRELALLYFCVAEDDAAYPFQDVGAALKLSDYEVVDLAMRLELKLLVEEVHWLVRVPDDLLYRQPLQFLEILQRFLRFIHADLRDVLEHILNIFRNRVGQLIHFFQTFVNLPVLDFHSQMMFCVWRQLPR